MDGHTPRYGKLHQEIKNKNKLVALVQLGKYKSMSDDKQWQWQRQIQDVHLWERVALSLCSGGWLSCPRWREQEPKAFPPTNHWHLACHLWPGARAGWVSQTSSGSYLIWCPQYLIGAKAARKLKGIKKKKKKSFVYNRSTLFYLCMTYCNLLWCKKN